MTIGELKAFIEGMAIQGAPTDEQWARILDKLETVTNAAYPPADIWWYTQPSNSGQLLRNAFPDMPLGGGGGGGNHGWWGNGDD